MEAGRFREAIPLMEKAISMNATIGLEIVPICYCRMGQFDAAEAAFERLIQLAMKVYVAPHRFAVAASAFPDTHRSPQGWTNFRSAGLIGWAVWTLGLMILAALAVALLPNVYSRVTSTLEKQPGMSLLAGFVTFIGIPIAAIFLLLTLIGLPLSLVLITIFLAMLILAFVATSAAIGDSVLRRFRPEFSSVRSWRVVATMLDVLLLGLAGMIPVVGGIVVFAALLLGLGAMIMQLWRPAAAVGA
jgi:hypothetical protein